MKANQPQNEWYTLIYTSKLDHYTDEEVSTFCVCGRVGKRGGVDGRNR